ncbi:protein-L-isoaspartate(D-aspartate) O-methyltransferase [Halyomorpha halys]|uniref:protein-L-isoaspartate(D-aspartate) O-methyltransferase n=1 Tax=Halyomorpha halys TaxID=286706 RepID=UPI0034D2E9C4
MERYSRDRIRGSWKMNKSKNSEWNQLILQLTDKGVIKSDKVKRIMMTVDRRNYVSGALDPYLDVALPIGFGAVIDAPHMHAMVLELLKDNLLPGARALDVGSGSGYLTACMGFMVGPSGLVVGIDNIAHLVQLSKQNILKGNSVLVGWNSIMFEEADGRLGYPKFAPYDVINVGAATQNIPEILIKQLAPGGRLVIPVGCLRSYQFLTQVDKRLDGNIQKKKIMTVKVVPLTDRNTLGRRVSQISVTDIV